MNLVLDLSVENVENISTNEILNVIQKLPKDVWTTIVRTEGGEEGFASTVSSATYTLLLETADQHEFLDKNVNNCFKESVHFDNERGDIVIELKPQISTG